MSPDREKGLRDALRAAERCRRELRELIDPHLRRADWSKAVARATGAGMVVEEIQKLLEHPTEEATGGE